MSEVTGPKIDTGLFSSVEEPETDTLLEEISRLMNNELTHSSTQPASLPIPPPPPLPPPVAPAPVHAPVVPHDMFGITEVFEHDFKDIREMYEKMMPVVKAFEPFTVKLFTDCVRWRLRHSEGTVDLTARLTSARLTGHAISIDLSYNPHGAAVSLHIMAKELAQKIQLQASLTAMFLRTGKQDSRLMLQIIPKVDANGKRTPGRPSLKASLNPQIANREVVAYDIVFQPLVQPTVTGEMQLTGLYQLFGISAAGLARAKLEQDLNYPPYRAEDIRTALYFLEGKGLRCYVQGPGQTIVMDGSHVVVEINGAKVHVPWAGSIIDSINPDFTDDE